MTKHNDLSPFRAGVPWKLFAVSLELQLERQKASEHLFLQPVFSVWSLHPLTAFCSIDTKPATQHHQPVPHESSCQINVIVIDEKLS